MNIWNRMKIRQVLPIAAILISGCSIPFVNRGEAKSTCDRIAAQAIQTDSSAEARDLAAQAAECYAELAQ